MSDSSASADPTLRELGESGVLSAIFTVLERSQRAGKSSVVVGPGDDAAVFTLAGQAVVTTDAMVEGVDFLLAWSSGFELGWKLAATNLSDVAAMGAVPKALTVTVLAPDSTRVSLLLEITEGISQACQTLAPGCQLVGGDLSHSDILAFSVTAIGETQGRKPVTRSGAQIGDVVGYAGELGLAGRGLSLLLERCQPASMGAQSQLAELWEQFPDELAAQLAPSPPVSMGPVAAEHGCTAMMDVSDSLSLDASRLGRASGVSLDLSSSALLACGGGCSLEEILTGGEDHGLLATFPEGALLPAGFRAIGVVKARSSDLLVDSTPTSPRGWDPYRNDG